MNNAIEKLNKEIKASDIAMAKRVGEYLIGLVKKHGEPISSKIMAEGKTIKGSIDAMRAVARKNDGVVSDEDGFEIVRQYYVITDDDIKSKSLEFDLDNFI